MNKLIIIFLIFLTASSCKPENNKKNIAIDQNMFSIYSNSHFQDGEYTVFKVEATHHYQKPLKYLEITAEALDGEIKQNIVESGAEIQSNLEIGENRLFHIRVRKKNIFEIRFKVTDFEVIE